MRVAFILDILLTLYTCILLLTLVEKTKLNYLLNLRRLRNLTLMTEGFLVLAILRLARLDLLDIWVILFMVILGCIFAVWEFALKYKTKTLKDGKCILDSKNSWYRKQRKLYRIVMVVIVIIICIIVVYSSKYAPGEKLQVIMNLGLLYSTSGTVVYLILIMLAEKKNGPIYFDKNKIGNIK